MRLACAHLVLSTADLLPYKQKLGTNQVNPGGSSYKKTAASSILSLLGCRGHLVETLF
jgi:hypothetical protein